jgi:hypothetical protein
MSSFPVPNNILNLPAAADLSSNQYQAVSLDASGVSVAITDSKSIGFLMNAPEAGEVCEIASIGGGAKGIAGGSITQGDYLKVDSGNVVVATLATDNIVGQALQNGVNGDVIAVLPLFNFGS